MSRNLFIAAVAIICLIAANPAFSQQESSAQPKTESGGSTIPIHTHTLW